MIQVSDRVFTFGGLAVLNSVCNFVVELTLGIHRVLLLLLQDLALGIAISHDDWVLGTSVRGVSVRT